MRPWRDPQPVTVPSALAAAVGGHPLVAETLARRGFSDPATALAFLDPARYTFAPASDLPGMARGVARLARALRAQEPVCVWGDFDVDGQTATALLVSMLSDLGAEVTYHVPRRETEGHGVNVHALKQVIAGGARLILTCDTGIAVHAAAAYARMQRVDMIITDHHELPETLPEAAAIINPRLLSGKSRAHPLADLPGVGVAYKLAEALYEQAGRPGEAEKHLDLVSLGIVADVALQRGDTRGLLQRGLAALRRAERLGVRALLEAADISAQHITEEHIGFVLGPRLNAAGRLGDAGQCVALLTTEDPALAGIIAADLEALNARRKQLCDQVMAGAEAQIAKERSLLDDAALVLSSPYWPAGIIGIVASRLVERYGKPTILIAAPPGAPGRASARSVEGINITAAIAAHAGLLIGYGGHPMAAGFTILAEQIPAFRRALSRTVAGMTGQREPEALQLDGCLALGELSLALVDDLARLAPFGAGNPPLTLLAERLQLRASRTVGRDQAHRLLQVADAAGAERQVIWWDGGGEEPPAGLFDLAYVARASSYRGAREVQVELIAVRPSAGAEAAAIRAPAQVAVLDCRQERDPLARLAELLAEGETAVWREGDLSADLPSHDRRTLPRADTLVIWTIPAGPAELREALARAHPTRVCLFASDPGMDQPEAFQRRLAGLVKHVLSAKGGHTTLAELAAATAQRAAVVQSGLAWLAARGYIRAKTDASGQMALAPGSGAAEPAETLRSLSAQLEAALAESAAYRAYYREAPPKALIPGA